MSKQEWTKEPWNLNGKTEIVSQDWDGSDIVIGITGAHYQMRTSTHYRADGKKAVHNAVRIVDCVNALEGINNPAEYISSLREENERLREALKPFADAYDPLECKEEGNRDDWDAWEQPEAMNVKICDFKRARQALTKEG